MHPEQEAFEKGIDANPLDGNHRLVYADWLDENGQSEEAAFQRSMGEWVKKGSSMDGRGWKHKTPGGFHVFKDNLPKGIHKNQLFDRRDYCISSSSYRSIEDTLRKAFMKNRQQQSEKMARSRSLFLKKYRRKK